MPVVATTAPSPGWYPDPNDADHLRWWDGHIWTEHVTDLPGRETWAFLDDTDFVGDDDDPIDFGWEDETESFVLTFLDPDPEPIAEPGPVAELAPFAFRADDFAPRHEPPAAAAEPDFLALIAGGESAGSAPVEVPADPQVQPEAPKPARRSVPNRAVKGSIGLVVCAALAAQVTNALHDDGSPSRGSSPAAAGITTADKSCLKEWNTTASGTAAELRVTLGQFTGAFARVGRVDPLPGTLMAPDSCALTVYDPATDTNVVFVSGVPDQVGYMDVTSYPRAKAYGWPRSATQSNVAVREDGTIAATS